MPFDTRTLTLDPGSWTTVTPPGDYDHVAVTNQGSDMLRMRPVTGQANEITIVPGVTQSVAAPPNHANQQYRFPAAAPAFALRPDSGTGPALVVWA